MFPYNEQVTCSNCGKSNTLKVLGSYSTFPSELDYRPYYTAPDALKVLVQYCRSCGYCAPSIETLIENVSDIINRIEYKKQLSNKKLPKVCNHYLCYAIIMDGNGNYLEAGYSKLRAAWICDDDKNEAGTIECRIRAIESFNTAISKGQVMGDDFYTYITLIDLYRRIGNFSKAEESCQVVLKINPQDKDQLKVIYYQKHLIEKRDSNRHIIKDAKSYVSPEEKADTKRKLAIVKEFTDRNKNNLKNNALTNGPLPEMFFSTIPSGAFQMGSNVEGEDDKYLNTHKWEKPVHSVTIPSFKIMTTQITRAMWWSLMDDEPSEHTGSDLPESNVSWDLCQVFIEKLNKYDPNNTYRLPSEAEWEYACRANNVTKYSLGDNEVALSATAWFEDNSGGVIHPVGLKIPNSWGLYDMHGNVQEWCMDSWHYNYKNAPSDGSARVSTDRINRVKRGGAARSNAFNCRSTCRSFDPPDNGSRTGFRLVCE